MRYYITIILFLSGLSQTFATTKESKLDTIQTTISQQPSAKNQNEIQGSKDDFEEDHELNMFLLVFALAGIGIILVFMGVGVILTLVFLGLVFAFTTFGILSTSILVGIQQKSFQKGFKTFMTLICGAGGLFVGTTAFWLWNKVVHWWTLKTTLFIGAFIGLSGGVLFGIVSTIVLRKIGTFLKNKLEEQKQKSKL